MKTTPKNKKSQGIHSLKDLGNSEDVVYFKRNYNFPINSNYNSHY